MREFIIAILIVMLFVLATTGFHSVIEDTTTVSSKCILFDTKYGTCKEVVYIKDDIVYRAVK